MKGERQQDGFRSSEERPFKFMYKAGDRAVGMEMSQAGSVALRCRRIYHRGRAEGCRRTFEPFLF